MSRNFTGSSFYFKGNSEGLTSLPSVFPPPELTGTLVVSTTTDVESVTSVVVDPEPHDVITIDEMTTNKIKNFLIKVNINKNNDNKKPQQYVGVFKVFQ